MYFEFFEFYILTTDTNGIGTRIDLCTRRRGKYLEFVGCRWERNLPIDQYGTFGIGDGQARLDGIACGILVFES